MLRPATEADVESIRRWRDHPEVRRHFIHSAEIDAEQHRAWWSRVNADPASRVLIYEDDGIPCAVVIFSGHDPATRSAEWGFFLDVEGLRGRDALFGVWVDLERAAIRYAFDDLGLAVLGGRTLASNTAVLELHRRSGFAEVPERRYRADIAGQSCDVLWMEMRAAGATS